MESQRVSKNSFDPNIISLVNLKPKFYLAPSWYKILAPLREGGAEGSLDRAADRVKPLCNVKTTFTSAASLPSQIAYN